MSTRPRPLILGIETSCDETAAAVVADGVYVLSNVVASQNELHERYRGVVPEIASRAHLENILPVVQEAISLAGVELKDLDAVAVGHRPGLIGSLLVGVSAAKALAWSLGVPFFGIDHVQAHLHAGLLDAPPVSYPALGLVVSGGHTSLYLLKSPGNQRVLGRTIDDAVGEAFDKVGAILGLSYPGGPAVDRLAAKGDDRAFDFPIGLLERDNLNFSFSGLKTAVLYAVKGAPAAPNRPDTARNVPPVTDQRKADIAASFQRAAITAITRKLTRALVDHPVSTILVGGGVSANSRLRAELQRMFPSSAVDLRLPRMEFCVDNAAMIAGAAATRLAHDQADSWDLSASATSVS